MPEKTSTRGKEFTVPVFWRDPRSRPPSLLHRYKYEGDRVDNWLPGDWRGHHDDNHFRSWFTPGTSYAHKRRKGDFGLFFFFSSTSSTSDPVPSNEPLIKGTFGSLVGRGKTSVQLRLTELLLNDKPLPREWGLALTTDPCRQSLVVERAGPGISFLLFFLDKNFITSRDPFYTKY